MGGTFFSIYRIWTEDVWVLSNKSGLVEMKNVSCISLAGWNLGMFNAEKLFQSSSISGPSERLKPTFWKIRIILFFTLDIGWWAPILSLQGGNVISIFFVSDYLCILRYTSISLVLFLHNIWSFLFPIKNFKVSSCSLNFGSWEV